MPEKVYAAAVQFKNSPGETSVFYIRNYLNQKLPQILSIVYKERLILLVEKTFLEDGRLEKFFKSYDEEFGCRIGVSDPVKNFLNLNIYYEQALRAVEIEHRLSSEEFLCSYRKLYTYHILLEAGNSADLNFLCDPAILAMQESDRIHNTEYLKDLSVYLSCGRSIQKAAAKACIHKNSMYYRIAR